MSEPTPPTEAEGSPTPPPPPLSPPPAPPPSPQRLALAKDSYAELEKASAALERKVGQLLVSSTFFVTAAAALLAIAEVRNFAFVFDGGSSVPLPLYHLIVFLALTSVGVVHLTMALGLSLKPRRMPGAIEVSYLAWWSMIHRPKSEWYGLFDRAEEDYDAYRLQHLLEQTRYAARMANYTYERLVEGRAYFFTAVTTFIAATPSLAMALTARGQDEAWTTGSAAWQAVTSCLMLFVSMNDRFRLESDVDTIRDSRRPMRQFKLLALLAPLSSGLAILASAGEWPFIALFAAALAILVVLLLLDSPKKRLSTVYDRVKPPWLLLWGAVGMILFSFESLRPWLLLYAFWPVLVSEGIRLLDNRLYRTSIKKLG